MKPLCSFEYDGQRLVIVETDYVDSSQKALVIMTTGQLPEHYCNLTVKIAGADALCAPGDYIIKTWSENEHIYHKLCDLEILKPIYPISVSQWCDAWICTLNPITR